jgi:hypothetical protein
MVGKPEGRRPAGRSRGRREDNIKLDFVETGWSGVDWIDLARGRANSRIFVNEEMNLRVQQNSGELSSVVSRRFQCHLYLAAYQLQRNAASKAATVHV